VKRSEESSLLTSPQIPMMALSSGAQGVFARSGGPAQAPANPVECGFYMVRNEEGEVYLLTLFAKSEKENIPLAALKEIRRALEV